MEEKILGLLALATGTDEVLREPGLPIWEEGVLDSFGLLEFLSDLEEQLGITLYPTQLSHSQLETPRALAAAVMDAARRQGIVK